MTLEEFEKQQEAKEQKKTSLTSDGKMSVSKSHDAHGTAMALMEAWEAEAQSEYDAYMFMGAGGSRRDRDHFGFHLPHRKPNDE